MTTNVIKQIVRDGEYGSQTIKMVVKSNERGPKGEKGDPGIQGPQGIPGQRGADGVIQYRAGTGINISDENIISATGSAIAIWGGVLGNIQNQSDLQNEFSQYTKTSNLGAVALSNNYNDLTNKPTIPTVNNATLTIKQNGTTLATFTANSSTAKTASIVSPVITMTTTDPGEGSALASNNYVGVYGGDPIILDYSTTEVNTGTKWIDGSAIYKKTIDCGVLPDNNSKNVAHNISSLGTIIKIEGISIATSGRTIPLPSVSGSVEYDVALDVYLNNVEITTYSDRTAYTNTYVTLYYTKSS